MDETEDVNVKVERDIGRKLIAARSMNLRPPGDKLIRQPDEAGTFDSLARPQGWRDSAGRSRLQDPRSLAWCIVLKAAGRECWIHQGPTAQGKGRSRGGGAETRGGNEEGKSFGDNSKSRSPRNAP
jgi:hypothetical protein